MKDEIVSSELLERYRQVNGSNQQSLAYGVGLFAGFFSEINLMILAVVYCLHHKIEFKLHSSSANFRLDKGWNDYFVPFCPEVSGKKIDEIDRRELARYEFDLTKPRRLLRMAKQKKSLFLLKKELGVDYFTFDLLDEIANRKLEKVAYDIPQLGIKGDLREACRIVCAIVWNLNDDTRSVVDDYAKKLSLPASYVGFQVRRGDKNTEIDLSDTARYIEMAQERSAIRDVFVLTDDYSVIEELNSKYSDWNIHTLCQPSERGYAHGDFFSKSREEIHQGTLKLIANIEILRKSALFVGTFSANPSMFLGMAMEHEKAISVDVPWQVWYGKEA